MKPSEALERVEWIRGEAYEGPCENPTGMCCVGAINFADPNLFQKFLNKAYDLLEGKGLKVSVSTWNDEYCKSKEEAVAFLRELEAYAGL